MMKVADEKASLSPVLSGDKTINYIAHIELVLQAKLRVTRKNEIIDEALVGDELTR
jgi:hypothetical protein